jgi:hypothetical protein
VNFEQIRLAALSWNGEGSYVFTSSSAPYDINDNGPCDEVGHISKSSFYFGCFDLTFKEMMIFYSTFNIHTSSPNNSVI